MKRLTKRFPAWLLVFALMLSLLAAPVSAETGAEVFRDVKADDWFFAPVDFCARKGLVNGTSADTFSPGMRLSRAMFVTILGRAANITPDPNAVIPFKDVKKGSWYYGYVSWAYVNGITSGVNANSFAPEAPVTREQLCTFLCRFATYMEYDMITADSSEPFADHRMISPFAIDSVYSCAKSGVVQGITFEDELCFVPKKSATRAEACTMLQRFINNCTNSVEEQDEPETPGVVEFSVSDLYESKASGYISTNETGNRTEFFCETKEGIKIKEAYNYDSQGHLVEIRTVSEDGSTSVIRQTYINGYVSNLSLYAVVEEQSPEPLPVAMPNQFMRAAVPKADAEEAELLSMSVDYDENGYITHAISDLGVMSAEVFYSGSDPYLPTKLIIGTAGVFRTVTVDYATNTALADGVPRSIDDYYGTIIQLHNALVDLGPVYPQDLPDRGIDLIAEALAYLES